MSFKSRLKSRKALAALAIGAVLGVPAVTVPLAVTATAASAPSPQYRSLSAEQIGNAKKIIATTKKHNFNERAMQIAIATSLQESSLRNLGGGDRDSVGLFQQRPSTGWGTWKQCHTPELATEAFLGVAKHTNNPGLKDIKGWQSMPLSVAAQKVQRSAYPSAYAKWEKLAKEIVERNNTKATPKPTPKPTAKPTTGKPTAKPTKTSRPPTTGKPTGRPTSTGEPTGKPTSTDKPTARPTRTGEPTGKPTSTGKPTTTGKPTSTSKPTQSPRQSSVPTVEPTTEPTEEPTVEPTDEPTSGPTVEPPATEPPAQTEPPAETPVDGGQGGYPEAEPVGDSKDPGGSATAGEAPSAPESSGGLASTGG